MGILDAFASLSSGVNKAKGRGPDAENKEGVVSAKLPELTLDMDNEDLISLTRKWEKTWTESPVKTEWEKAGDENEKYVLGKHFDRPAIDKSRPMVDNVIFESLETYLPQITRRNPEPMVQLDSRVEETEDALRYASDVQDELGEIADELKLRLKLKKAARHWAIYLLGVAKPGWDIERDAPTLKIIRPRKMILDPTATVDEDGYTGEYTGEYRKMPASKLLSALEAMDAEEGAVKAVKDLVKDDLGTEVQFIEWWTSQYTCWTLGKQVLMKKKNLHWNYPGEAPAPADEFTGLPPVDEEGKPVMVETPALPNHFAAPRKPYIFLSVFNLGKQPVDDTSNIGQNLANQDRVNKRNRQIDKNADGMNNGMVVSKERSGLTDSQAKNASRALLKGGVVVIPAGAPRDAIDRMTAPALPPDIYNDLVDTRNRIRDIFGTRGSTAAGIESESTVRGKIISRGLDTDRIGGGVSEYLEQFADDIYNWFVQLLYVYDDERATGAPVPAIRISVKEGSLLPKDSTSIANQAIELATGGKMSLVDLYKRLDYPNPEELAANAWLEVNAPQLLYANDPRVAQAVQQAQASAEPAKPPSESISYKDLTPDAKAQMLAKAGIEAHPEAIAAHDEHKAGAEAMAKAAALPSPAELEGGGQP